MWILDLFIGQSEFTLLHIFWFGASHKFQRQRSKINKYVDSSTTREMTRNQPAIRTRGTMVGSRLAGDWYFSGKVIFDNQYSMVFLVILPIQNGHILRVSRFWKEVWTCSENKQIPYSSLITCFSTFFGVYHRISAMSAQSGMGWQRAGQSAENVQFWSTMTVYGFCGWTFVNKAQILFIFWCDSYSYPMNLYESEFVWAPTISVWINNKLVSRP